MLLAKLFDQHCPVSVFQISGVEILFFCLQDVLGDVYHFFRKCHWRNVGKVLGLASNLVRVAQRYAAKSRAHRLDHNGSFAIRENDAPQADKVLPMAARMTAKASKPT